MTNKIENITVIKKRELKQDIVFYHTQKTATDFHNDTQRYCQNLTKEIAIEVSGQLLKHLTNTIALVKPQLEITKQRYQQRIEVNKNSTRTEKNKINKTS